MKSVWIKVFKHERKNKYMYPHSINLLKCNKHIDSTFGGILKINYLKGRLTHFSLFNYLKGRKTHFS